MSVSVVEMSEGKQKSKNVASNESPFRRDVLSGKVALITGGASGIGLEISRQLLLHGCKLAIFARRQHMLDKALKELTDELNNYNKNRNVTNSDAGTVSIITISGDVRLSQDVERAVQLVLSTFGKLNVVINGAAGNFLCPAEELSVNGYRSIMEIDALGTFLVSKTAYPHLRAAGGGSIINVSATLQTPATWYQLGASAAKSAVDSMTRTMALEWASDNIRVNAVAPGPIDDTPGWSKLSAGMGTESVSSIVPIGRLGTKFEVAMLVLFLLTDQANYITGNSSVIIDGGQWLWRPAIVDKSTVQSFSRNMETQMKKSNSQPVALAAPRSRL